MAKCNNVEPGWKKLKRKTVLSMPTKYLVNSGKTRADPFQCNK